MQKAVAHSKGFVYEAWYGKGKKMKREFKDNARGQEVRVGS